MGATRASEISNLIRIAFHQDKQVRLRYASADDSAPELLELLCSDADLTIALQAIRNRNHNKTSLQRLSEHSCSFIRQEVALHSNTASITLIQLVGDDSQEIRQIAEDRLIFAESNGTRLEAVRSGCLSRNALGQLLLDNMPGVRKAAQEQLEALDEAAFEAFDTLPEFYEPNRDPVQNISVFEEEQPEAPVEINPGLELRSNFTEAGSAANQGGADRRSFTGELPLEDYLDTLGTDFIEQLKRLTLQITEATSSAELPEEDGYFLPEAPQDLTELQDQFADLYDAIRPAETDITTPIYDRVEQLSAYDIALQAATRLAKRYSWEPHLSILTEVFLFSSHHKTQTAISHLIADGITADELELLLKLKWLWSENDHYATTFQYQFGSWVSKDAYQNLSWKAGYLIIRSFASTPDIDEIHFKLEQWYDHWKDAPKREVGYAFLYFLLRLAHSSNNDADIHTIFATANDWHKS